MKEPDVYTVSEAIQEKVLLQPSVPYHLPVVIHQNPFHRLLFVS